MAIKENSTSKAICFNCETLVSTTYKVRSVSFENGLPPIKILAGVCDICDNTVSIPAESITTIKNHREKYE